MRNLSTGLLSLLTILTMISNSSAVEMHTFDFSGDNVPLSNTFDGRIAGRYTSLGTVDDITVDISNNFGALDFTTAPGNLGATPSPFDDLIPQSITLNFSSLSDAPLHIHSIAMTSPMDIGSPLMRTQEFMIDPTISSRSLYRYTGAQSILLGSYLIPESGGVVFTVDNLQYGYHSIQSITIASQCVGMSVPEPAATLLWCVGLTMVGFLRIRH